MYIVKNAYLNIIRKKGRNILIGIIISIITISAALALSIHASGTALVETYRNSKPLEIDFRVHPENFQKGEGQVSSLTVEDIQKYGNSSYVKDYYYTEEIALSSKDVNPVSYNTDSENQIPAEDGGKPVNTGDFRLTGYSDPSYIAQFISGNKKIKEGAIFTKDSAENEIIISESLATENKKNIGDTIVLYHSTNEEQLLTCKIIGIYEDTSDVTENSFMNMNALQSSNQIYTSTTTIANISNKITQESKGMGISVKYYLHNNDDVRAFEKEVRKKGLDDAYTLSTNEEEVLASVRPIQNVSQFSLTFLVLILIVGAVVLGVINLINIKERTYEIGVLRAIGMSKKKVAMQFVIEIFIVALIALVIGTSLGTVMAQPVTNKVLRHEIESYEESQKNRIQNFGSVNFERPALRGNNTDGKVTSVGRNVDYVNSLSVHMDFITIVKLLLVSLLLTLTTSILSIIMIARYEPSKILQNR